MRYILLLRGINVGGKNKVSMSDLKKLLLNTGFEDVDSYINSGNLFFSTDESRETCLSKISNLLEDHYDFAIPFALLTQEAYLQAREELPDWWGGELARKDVLFFSHNSDKSAILEFFDQTTFSNERVHIGKHAVFLGKEDEAEYLKSTYHKQLKKQNFYKEITIRNGKTFEKIAEILENGR